MTPHRPPQPARTEATMFTNPNPPSELNKRMDAYAALLSAGHFLYQSVLALQFVDAQGDLSALREHLITELYRASDLYIDAYMKVYPKAATPQQPAQEADHD